MMANDIQKINDLIESVKKRRTKNMKKTLQLTDSDSEDENVDFFKKMNSQGKYLDRNGFVQNKMDHTTDSSNDMKYTMLTPTQHEQLGTYDSTFTNAWDNEYTLLNTDKWKPALTHATHREQANKLAPSQSCGVSPVLTSGYPVRLKDFDLARKVLPPDNINIDYIKEKLLTGIP